MSAALGSLVRRTVVRKTVVVAAGKVASVLAKDPVTLRCDNLVICSAVALRIHDEKGKLKAIVVGHRSVYDREFKQNLLQEMKKIIEQGNTVCIEAYHTAANPSVATTGSAFGQRDYSSHALEEDLYEVLVKLNLSKSEKELVMKQLREKQVVGPRNNDKYKSSQRTLIIHSNEDGTVSVEKPDDQGMTQVTWIVVAGLVTAAAAISYFFVSNNKK